MARALIAAVVGSVELLDQLGGWLLAGLAMAKIVRPAAP